jgi:hypothetical protein
MTYEHDSWIVSTPVFPQLAYRDVKYLSIPTEGDLVLGQWVAVAVAGSIQSNDVDTVGRRNIQQRMTRHIEIGAGVAAPVEGHDEWMTLTLGLSGDAPNVMAIGIDRNRGAWHGAPSLVGRHYCLTLISCSGTSRSDERRRLDHLP